MGPGVAKQCLGQPAAALSLALGWVSLLLHCLRLWVWPDLLPPCCGSGCVMCQRRLTEQGHSCGQVPLWGQSSMHKNLLAMSCSRGSSWPRVLRVSWHPCQWQAGREKLC